MSNSPNQCDAIYCARYVVTQNKSRDIIEQGAIALAGDSILSIGHSDILRIIYPNARVVELGNAVLLPGLINAHTHVPMSALRGYSDDKALMDWLTQDIFPIEDQLTAEIIELSARFSFAEMIRTGTTAFYDMYMLQEGVMRAADEMGMRGVVGESYTQYFPSLVAPNKEELFAIMSDRADRWRGHSRVKMAITPHAPYTSTPELLQEGYALAESYDLLFGMHLAETPFETATCLENYGKRPVAYCADLGIVSPRSSFFHLVDVNQDDRDMLFEGGCTVVHNPASNMKLASGCSPIDLMRKQGIRLALGTDGPASNNAQNMFREMYVASLMQKLTQGDPTACPAQAVLDMATLGGASAIGEPMVGCLEPGMKADFCALDLSTPNMQPCHNIVSNLVYAASGHECFLSVVDGRELYRNGKHLSCDYDALCDEMEKIRLWVKSQSKS